MNAGPTPPIKYKIRPTIKIDFRLNFLLSEPDKSNVGKMNKEDIVTTHCINSASILGNATASGFKAGAAIIVPKVVVTTIDNNAILALAFNLTPTFLICTTVRRAAWIATSESRYNPSIFRRNSN
ncbi:hypothetical protein GCM10010917_08340 [Paenibacillus physcomitrellae]|uniref:Uncharacterized protein n=1 Tax=Paenibacillus physcomitrellae TaxID=1619311 RepID=A0ABQ1FRN9_9BACL|nr:hypothetical protein GCM10010917_08340 [Paenibacillus physcomitrellae]